MMSEEPMTAEYVRVRTEDGTYIPFEIDSDYDGPVLAGRRLDEAIERAGETLEAGIDRAKEIARSVATRIGSLPPPRPDKVAVEIGLKVSAGAGVVVAKATSEAHIKITVEWQQHTEPSEQSTR
jgi:hypothetical protein